VSDTPKPIRGYALRSGPEWIEDPAKDKSTRSSDERHVFPTEKEAREWVRSYRARHASKKKFTLVKILKARKVRLENVLYLTAKRVSPASDREYIFKYTKHPAYAGGEAGVPIPFQWSSIRIPIEKLWYFKEVSQPFRIVEHDNFSAPGGVVYPVNFEVTALRWETVEI
jgi:hypothetical protein